MAIVDMLRAEPINWEGRHSELCPEWYQQKRVSEAASLVFYAVSSVTLGATILFKAAAQSTGILTSIFLVTVALYLTQKEHWNDPTYRLEQGQKAAKDIEKNRLSYPEIMQKYGERIKQFQILNEDDLNKLLRVDIVSLSKDEFTAKHGQVPILDSENKKILFLQGFRANNRFQTPYKDIRARKECKVKRDDFQVFFKNDLEDVMQFRKLHGPGIYEKLNENNQQLYRNQALEHIVISGYGIVKSMEEFPELENLTAQVFESQVRLLLGKQIDYNKFRKNNNKGPFLKLFTTPQKEAVKPLFFEFIKNRGLSNIKKFRAECEFFEVKVPDLLSLEFEALEKGDRTYAEFKKRNGMTVVEKNSSLLKPFFLRMGYSSLISPEFEEDRKTLKVKDADIKKALEADAERLTLKEFVKKHTVDGLQIISGVHRATLEPKKGVDQ
jgi:hypothetical protein